MGSLIIHSKVYGSHEVIYDDSDHILISNHTWCIQKRAHNNSMYAVTNTPRPNRKLLPMHHLIMGSNWIDHINQNGLDNRRINLRKATSTQNSFNKKPKKNNLSGYKGVSTVILPNGKVFYDVRCHAKGKRVYGGFFSDVVEAAKKYNELAKDLHGEFAYLNNV